MKRKSILLLLVILLTFIFTSCSKEAEILMLKNKKPSNYYYSSILYNSFKVCSSCKLVVLETNYYKSKDFSGDDINIVKSFFKCLNKSNFVNKPENLPKMPSYKIKCCLDSGTYIINVYNERYLSIQPWDGYYAMDYIDMSNVYASYNLFYLCQYIISQKL